MQDQEACYLLVLHPPPYLPSHSVIETFLSDLSTGSITNVCTAVVAFGFGIPNPAAFFFSFWKGIEKKQKRKPSQAFCQGQCRETRPRHDEVNQCHGSQSECLALLKVRAQRPGWEWHANKIFLCPKMSLTSIFGQQMLPVNKNRHAPSSSPSSTFQVPVNVLHLIAAQHQSATWQPCCRLA